MQKLKDWFARLDPVVRKVFVTISIITWIFLIFTLATLPDLLAPQDYRDFIINPIPALISLFGILALFFALKGKTHLASYMMIAANFVGFLLIAIFSVQPAFTTVAQWAIVIIPIMIAIQTFSDFEITWIVVAAVLARSLLQIIGTLKFTTPTTGPGSLTLSIAEWASAIAAILFGIYIAFNLNNYAFRVKMILVLGLLSIIPTAILTSITSNYIQTNLINQANQSLVTSSNQMALSIDSFIQTNLDLVRTSALNPALVNYLSQPSRSNSNQGVLLPRGTDLEKSGLDTLLAFLKKDPINILSVKLLDRFAEVQLSTDPLEIGKFEFVQNDFLIPYNGGIPYASPVTIDSTGAGQIHFSAPIRSVSGLELGVLNVTYSAAVLQQSVVRNTARLTAGESAMLLDENGIVLANSSAPELLYKIINPINNLAISDLVFNGRLQDLPYDQLSLQMTGLTEGLKNLAETPNFTGSFQPQVLGAAQFASLDQVGASRLNYNQWVVLTYVPQSTLLAPVERQLQGVVLISILISLASIAIALGLTQVLVAPIISLTRTSEQIAQGNMDASAVVLTHDEIGVLAQTFNAMTGRVRDLIGNLENRVLDRTKDLERRAVQLQAAADVGGTAARMRNLNELLRQVTRLISQRFGFYHVGIFMMDDRGEYAVLRAANSEGGTRMLARGHKLKVGQVGIVGNVTGTGQSRIALNVGEDAQFFNNPDLPTTQSELALPLIVGGRILGALDIQSSQENAFTQDDITTLRVLADQIAIAIDNARLFTESQIALETAQRAYGNLSSEGWQKLLKERFKMVGYSSLEEGQTVPISDDAEPGFLQAVQSGQNVFEKDGTVLHLPVRIRGQTIGAIRMERPAGSGPWTDESVGMATTLSVQLGAALESARLYQDISLRAQRDATIAEISGRIGGSLRMESILRTTAEELSRIFSDANILVQLKGAQEKSG